MYAMNCALLDQILDVTADRFIRNIKAFGERGNRLPACDAQRVENGALPTRWEIHVASPSFCWSFGQNPTKCNKDMECLLTLCGVMSDVCRALCGLAEETAATILRPEFLSVPHVG
jgi:hypothetical protein